MRLAFVALTLLIKQNLLNRIIDSDLLVVTFKKIKKQPNEYLHIKQVEKKELLGRNKIR